MDWYKDQSRCYLSSKETLWDTGAHCTIVAEEKLPDDYIDYLKDPIHNAYRVENSSRVQLQATIEFSSSVIEIDIIAVVVYHLDMLNH